MDNTEKEQGKASFEFHKNNHSNEYKFLAQRLKSIRDSIFLIEKNFNNK